MEKQFHNGEITYLNLPVVPTENSAQNPWLTIAGKYADDPNWDEYLAEIAAAREAVNVAAGMASEDDTVA